MSPQQFLYKVLTAIGIRKEKYYLFQNKMTEEVHQLNPLADGFEAIEITADNVGDFDFSLFKNKYERLVSRLFIPSYRLFVVEKGKKVCYYTWISLDDFIFPRYVKQSRKLNADDAFLFDSACAEEYKGRGFHSYMNIYRLQKIFENGKNNALVLVLADNTPAIKVQYKSGMKIIKIMKTFHCNWLGIDKVTFTDYEDK